MRNTRLASTSCLLFAMVSLIALLPTSAAAELTAQQAALIEQGFKVFNTQTFKGNGRTCTTCHLPSADFNISDGVNGAATEVGTGNTPTGPFRASMTIAGLAFTTSNLLPDFCSSSS